MPRVHGVGVGSKATTWIRIVGALAALSLLAGCTDANLYGKVGQEPKLIDKVSIVGTLCTSNPATRQFPVKILFIVDGSGIMQTTAPFGEHVLAMEQTISQFLPIANTSLGVIRYDDDATQLTSELVGRINSGYTRDDAQIDTALVNLRNGSGARDLRSAMSLARSIITGDAFQADLGPLSRTKYVVVHVTSGSPNPRVQANTCDEVFDQQPPICEIGFFEKQVRDIREQVLELGAAEFVFHTVFVEPSHIEGEACDPRNATSCMNPGLACVQTSNRPDIGRCAEPCAVDADCINAPRRTCATTTLADGSMVNYCASGELNCFDGFDNDGDGRDVDCSDPNYDYFCNGNAECDQDCLSSCRADRLGLAMSLVTGGRYERFTYADQINFARIDFRSTQRLFKLKEFLVFNSNAIPSKEGFLPDTDADGLSDIEEDRLGIDPLSSDSDGDFYNDRLEHLLRTLNLDPLVPNTFEDCEDPTIDTDGDGLRDCEEKLLGTNKTLFDTDADGFPDKIEFRIATNPLFADALDDIDLDGVNNGQEIRAHTDTLTNDATVRSELAYRYRTVDLDVTADQRSCYDFRTSNVTLVETRDRGFGPGNNNIDVYFGQVPDGSLDGFGIFSATQVRVQYLPPDTRIPDTPAISLQEDDFVYFDQ